MSVHNLDRNSPAYECCSAPSNYHLMCSGDRYVHVYIWCERKITAQH